MLPRESRVVQRIKPEAAWGEAEAILARIELWTHAQAWSNTKDAAHNRNKPKMIEIPGSREKKEEKRKKTDLAALKAFLAQPREEVPQND